MTRRQQDLRQGHEYVLDRLSLYIDRQLTVKERDRVETHLRSCPSCREELQTLQWTKDLLQQVPVVPVPRSFVIRKADLAPHRAVDVGRRPAFALQWATALVAVLLVIVVAGDLLIGGRSTLSGGQPEIAMLSKEAPMAAEEAPVAAAVEEPAQQVETPAKTPQELAPPAPESTLPPAAKAIEQAQSLQADAPVTGTTAPPPMMGKDASPEGTPPDKDVRAGDEGRALSKGVTPESPVERESKEPVARDAETVLPPDEQAPEPIEETPMAMALPPAAKEQEALDEPETGFAGQGMRSGLLARWMSSGWRWAEVGLGLLLIGLIVVVIWVRRKH
jgi:anti-sigma factor RsiW